MEINLNGKHLATIGVAFLLGGIIGYLIKGQSACPEQQAEHIQAPAQTRSYNQPSNSQRTSDRQTITRERTTATYQGSRPQGNARQQKQAEQIFEKVTNDLNMSTSQKEQALSVIEKNFPNQEYLNGNLNMGQILNTVNELKPILSDDQTAELEKMVMQEVMKRGIR